MGPVGATCIESSDGDDAPCSKDIDHNGNTDGLACWGGGWGKAGGWAWGAGGEKLPSF
jgi:hypothetical protein